MDSQIIAAEIALGLVLCAAYRIISKNIFSHQVGYVYITFDTSWIYNAKMKWYLVGVRRKKMEM